GIRLSIHTQRRALKGNGLALARDDPADHNRVRIIRIGALNQAPEPRPGQAPEQDPVAGSQTWRDGGSQFSVSRWHLPPTDGRGTQCAHHGGYHHQRPNQEPRESMHPSRVAGGGRSTKIVTAERRFPETRGASRL